MSDSAHLRFGSFELQADEHGDVASASLIENWIDEAERRVWFLFEASRRAEAPGG
jgi:DNA-binding ferritin-like protein